MNERWKTPAGQDVEIIRFLSKPQRQAGKAELSRNDPAVSSLVERGLVAFRDGSLELTAIGRVYADVLRRIASFNLFRVVCVVVCVSLATALLLRFVVFPA